MCRRIGCRRITTDIGRALFVCGGCRRFRYCSRDCQKRAWTHEVVAHRRICRTVALLCGRQTMPSGSDLMRRDVTISDMLDDKSKLPILASPWLLRYVIDAVSEYAVADGQSYDVGHVWV